MIGRILGVVSRPARPEPVLPALDDHVTLAALLVRLARSDGPLNLAEITTIDEVLKRRLGLNGIAAAQLRASGETLEREYPHTEALGRLLAHETPAHERDALMDDLLLVVNCDGPETGPEHNLMERIEALLPAPAKTIQMYGRIS